MKIILKRVILYVLIPIMIGLASPIIYDLIYSSGYDSGVTDTVKMIDSLYIIIPKSLYDAPPENPKTPQEYKTFTNDIFVELYFMDKPVYLEIKNNEYNP